MDDHPYDPAVLRGSILRAWREHQGLTVRQAALRASLSPSTVSMWESGLRWRAGHESKRRLSEYGLAIGLSTQEVTCLLDLWHALTVPECFPARTKWTHAYAGPSGPIWALYLPAHPAAETGSFSYAEPIQGRVDLRSGPVLLTAPASLPNPPAQFLIDGPGGWVACGRGVVPSTVAAALGLEVVDGRARLVDRLELMPSAAPDGLSRFADRLSVGRAQLARLGLGWELFIGHLDIGNTRPVATALDGFTPLAAQASPPLLDERGDFVSQVLVPPEQLRRARRGQGLSMQEAAQMLTALMPEDPPVSARQIASLEEGCNLESLPSHILSGLDHVLGGEGWLGLESQRVVQHESRWVPRFPSYWRGPIWIQCVTDSADGVGTVTLTWGPWRRHLRVRAGTVLTTTRTDADHELRIHVPPGWRVVVGTGACPTALDVNEGWRPSSVKAVGVLLRGAVRHLAGS